MFGVLFFSLENSFSFSRPLVSAHETTESTMKQSPVSSPLGPPDEALACLAARKITTLASECCRLNMSPKKKKSCGNSKHDLFELLWHSAALGTVAIQMKYCSVIFFGSSS